MVDFSDELRFDAETVLSLLKTAPRMKPAGLVRAYKVKSAFMFDNVSMEAGDYLVKYVDGSIRSEPADFIERVFLPVKKRMKSIKSKE